MSNRKHQDLEDLVSVPDFKYANSGIGQSDGGDDRNRKNKKTKTKTKNRNTKFNKFTRVLSLLYLVALLVFEIALVMMDVVSTELLLAIIIVLSLLSIVIFIQLFFKNIKKWAKVMATILSILLIAVYGVGAAYSMGTLSFLDAISNTNNENSVNVRKEPFNVLITGMDVTGSIDTEGRSDVNMLVTVNQKSGEILMTSIPRDYEVSMVNEGGQSDKLTHTGFYGVDDTIAAVEDLFDVKVNYYVKVNFSTVVQFVDAVGGVDVYSEYEFEPIKYQGWTVQKGWNHMDGAKALAFARERKAFEEGDNQRIKNQQAVLQAVLKKALSSKTVLLKYPKILSSLSDYVEMNMSSSEIRNLVKLQISKNIKWKMEKHTLSGHDANMGTYTTGSQQVYVMAQDEESISEAKDMINAVLSRTKDSDKK